MKPLVSLVIPPSPFLLDERVFVSLGILKVAASLESLGYGVEVIDLSGVANFEEAAAECLSPRSVAVGITATTPQMPAVARIVARLREVGAPKIIIGGPHPTLVNAAARKGNPRALVGMAQLRAMADVIVAGDGEDAIEAALYAEPGTIIDADDPKSAMFLTSKRLNETPWPARHLVDLESYHYTIDGERACSAIWQLGCPMACVFCGGRFSPMLRRIRMRSTANVLAEMESLATDYGYSAVMAYDDELNVNRSMVELMHGIAALGRRLGIKWKLRGFIKAELFTAEQADAMREAGFRWILVGFESGSERILANIQKQATVEDNDRCMAIARAAGLKVKALMSLGHAGETEETIRDTQEWLLRVKPDDFDATVITTYPGAPYHDEAVETAPGVWTYTAKKSGDRLHAEAVDFTADAAYYKGRSGEYVSHVWTDALSPADLVRLRDGLEAKVRAELGIPFNASAASISYEHSMGQGLVRTSAPRSEAVAL